MRVFFLRTNNSPAWGALRHEKTHDEIMNIMDYNELIKKARKMNLFCNVLKKIREDIVKWESLTLLV